MATPVVDLSFCTPAVPEIKDFNKKAVLPLGLKIEHVHKAMNEFTDFLGFIDTELCKKGMERFEDMLMSANFSSMVGEFMTASIPKHCKTLAKNTYHNGHPDILPAGKYPDNAAQHAGSDGIEVKASRYLRGWQGHNAEDAWLMIFVFEAGRTSDARKGIKKAPFRFLMVAGALLSKDDWQFAGRSETSRRTITASVKRSGYDKMMANWIYKAPALSKGDIDLLSVNDEA
jgi:hypothetical protein